MTTAYRSLSLCCLAACVSLFLLGCGGATFKSDDGGFPRPGGTGGVTPTADSSTSPDWDTPDADDTEDAADSTDNSADSAENTSTSTESVPIDTAAAISGLVNAASNTNSTDSQDEPPPPIIDRIAPNVGPIGTARTLRLSGSGFTSSLTVTLNGAAIPSTFVSSNLITVDLPASDMAIPGNYEFTVTEPGTTSNPKIFTAYVSIVNNSMVYNSANGLVYVTVPSSAGDPYGDSVVSVDPSTGALGQPIPVGSEPNRIAVSGDGKFLWVGLDGSSEVRRVNLSTGAADIKFSIAGKTTGTDARPATVYALAVLPGSDTSVVVATDSRSPSGSPPSLAIYRNGVLRSSVRIPSSTAGIPSYVPHPRVPGSVAGAGRPNSAFGRPVAGMGNAVPRMSAPPPGCPTPSPGQAALVLGVAAPPTGCRVSRSTRSKSTARPTRFMWPATTPTAYTPTRMPD